MAHSTYQIFCRKRFIGKNGEQKLIEIAVNWHEQRQLPKIQNASNFSIAVDFQNSELKSIGRWSTATSFLFARDWDEEKLIRAPVRYLFKYLGPRANWVYNCIAASKEQMGKMDQQKFIICSYPFGFGKRTPFLWFRCFFSFCFSFVQMLEARTNK